MASPERQPRLGLVSWVPCTSPVLSPGLKRLIVVTCFRKSLPLKTRILS
jgi:hypothetical protein